METKIRKIYYTNENLHFEHSYVVVLGTEIRHGIQKNYRMNGSLTFEYNYRFGLEYGIEKCFESGQLEFIQQHKNNIYHGICIIFNY
jgi:antitoxin component YwqK of YwqJK toxin-antitoxin module